MIYIKIWLQGRKYDVPAFYISCIINLSIEWLLKKTLKHNNFGIIDYECLIESQEALSHSETEALKKGYTHTHI